MHLSRDVRYSDTPETPKRQKTEPGTPDNAIVISDDEDEPTGYGVIPGRSSAINSYNSSSQAQTPSKLQSSSQPQTSYQLQASSQPQMAFHSQASSHPQANANHGDSEVPKDHMGRPLSPPALSLAQQYWDCQRKLDACPMDNKDAAASLPFDVLLNLAWLRRCYTREVLGLPKMEPGTRTYEPPFVEARPAGMPGPSQPVPAPMPQPKTEPVLCPEQLRVVELAASGKNIFYTGSAGCGKSTVLHAIRKRLETMGMRVRVMAPTGKVALAINGTTTWTFAGWTPDHHKRSLDTLRKAAKGKTVRKRLTETDVVIIDEISMVENLHFERLNAIMKVARRNDTAPFGGVQVIVTGDFCQLPPVKPFQHCIHCGSDLVSSMEEDETIHRCPRCCSSWSDNEKWAFKSKAWAECNFVHIHLNSIHRQSDNEFISLLQKCRVGDPFTQQEIDLLMNHQSVTANAVKLFSTREEVKRTNDAAFARLKTPVHTFRCFDRFLWDKERHPNLEYKGQKNPDGSLRGLEDHRFERVLNLKVGMLVVLLVNLDLSLGLCNGSQGIICRFDPYDPNKLPRKAGPDNPDGIVGTYATIREAHIRQFSDEQLKENQSQGGKGLFWPVVRFLNGRLATIMPECHVHELGDESPYSLLCRTQIPLTAAWALSIHKSQGMTLDRVIVDLSRAFEEGQVYVALSRATSLKGLKIEGDPSGLMVGKGGNAEVRRFLKEKFGL
jgi:ATP-dependent DNA helicase PIF1